MNLVPYQLDPALQALFASQGTIPRFDDRATMARLIREETATWRPIIERLGLRLD